MGCRQEYSQKLSSISKLYEKNKTPCVYSFVYLLWEKGCKRHTYLLFFTHWKTDSSTLSVTREESVFQGPENMQFQAELLQILGSSLTSILRELYLKLKRTTKKRSLLLWLQMKWPLEGVAYANPRYYLTRWHWVKPNRNCSLQWTLMSEYQGLKGSHGIKSVTGNFSLNQRIWPWL